MPEMPNLPTGQVGKGENEAHQDNGEGQGGQGQIGSFEPEAWDSYDEACKNGTQRPKRDAGPGRDVKMQIQQSRTVCAHTEKKGVAEIHLAGKAGEQIPAGGQYGKDARLG